MPVLIKICGLTTAATVDATVRGGATHIGLVFYAPSPRDLSADAAAALAQRVPAHVRTVGVFVDPARDLIERVFASVRLDVVQLHGSESADDAGRIRDRHGCEVWKAIPVRARADLTAASGWRGAVDRILFDAKTDADLPGGMGVRFDWRLLDGFAHAMPWGLSGGLDATNVAEALRITGAPLIDVSSGVETAPGIKSVDKIAAFLKAASLS